VCLGDSAYSIGIGMITPFPHKTQDAQERQFNRRHSGIRTLFTECVFGRLKRMYPVLTDLRYYVENSQKVIMACCILFNLRALLGTDPDEIYSDEALMNFRNLDEEVEFQEETLSDGAVRRAGQALRNRMKMEMRRVR